MAEPLTDALPFPKDVQDRLDFTKAALLSSRPAKLVKATGSFLAQVEAVENYWERLGWTFVASADDPKWRWTLDQLGQDEDSKLLRDHYNSPDSKEHRLHLLDTGDKIGRYMYTATYLSNRAWSYKPTEDSGFALGPKGLIFKNAYLLDRIRSIANSPEAAKFSRDHGDLLVDLPANLAWAFANPLFMAVSRVPEYVQYAHRDKYIREMLGKSKDAVRQILRQNFERGIMAPGQSYAVDKAWRLARDGKVDDLHRLLTTFDFRKPSVLSQLDLRYVRPAEKEWSPQTRWTMLRHDEALREADKMYLAAARKSEKLSHFLDTATAEQLLDYTHAINDGPTMAQIAAQIMDGRRPAMDPEVLSAWREHNKVAKWALLQREKNWNTARNTLVREARIDKNLEEIEKLKNDSIGGKLKPENVGKIERLRLLIERDRNPVAPPSLQLYHQRLAQETIQGRPLASWEARNRAYMSPKDVTEPTEKYLAKVREMPVSKLRAAWKDSLSRLAGQPAGEFREGSFKQLVLRLDQEIAGVTNAPEATFGGGRSKGKMLSDLRDMKELAMKAGTEPEQAFVRRLLNFTSNSLKQLNLYAPGGQVMYAGRVHLDNATKAFFTTGGRSLFSEVPSGSRVGTELDFSRGLMGRELADRGQGLFGGKGIMDTAALRWYKDNFVTPVTRDADSYWMNQAGKIVYHDKLAELDRLERNMPAQQKHDAAHAFAQQYVNRTFFFSESPAPILALADKVLNLGTGQATYPTHWARNMLFYAGMAVEHPAVASGLLELREKIKDASVDGQGSLRVSKDRTLNPLSVVTFNHAANILDHTDALPLDGGDPALERSVKFLRALDSFGTAFAKDPNPFYSFAGKTLAGEEVPILPDTDTASGRRDARAQLMRLRGPLKNVDELSKPFTGKSVMEHAAESGVLGEGAARAQEEYFEKGAKMVQRAMAAKGENLTAAEAERVFMATRAQEMSLRLATGLDLRVDPDAAFAQFRNLRSEYQGLQTQAERQDWWTRHLMLTPGGVKPLLKGIDFEPGEIPENHPEREFLERFKNANPDDKKVLWKEAEPQQRKGIIENGMDWGLKMLKKAGDLGADLLTGGAHAGAEELPAGVSDSPERVKARMRASFPDPRDLHLLYETPMPSSDNSLQFFDLAHTDANSEDRRRVVQENAKLNTVVRTMFSRAATAKTDDEFVAAYTDPVPMGGGKKFYPVPFFGNPRDGKNSMLMRAIDQGVTHPVTDPWTGKEALLHSTRELSWGEAKDYFIGGVKPARLLAQERQEQHEQHVELAPFLNAMRATVTGHGLGSFNSKPLEEAFRSSAGDASRTVTFEDDTRVAVPQDLYRRVIDSGNQALLSAFAVSTKSHMLDNVYNHVRVPDVDGSSHLNEGFLQGMLATHLADLPILGLRDRGVANWNAAHGIPTDQASIAREATIEFFHRNDKLFGDRPIQDTDINSPGGIAAGWDVHYKDATTPWEQRQTAQHDIEAATAARTGGKTSVPGPSKPTTEVAPFPSVPAGPVSKEAGIFPDLTKSPTPNFEQGMDPPNPRYIDAVTGQYRNTTLAVHDAAERTAGANKRITDAYDAYRAAYPTEATLPPPMHSVFSTARESLPQVDPLSYGQFASAVTGLAAHLNLLSPEPHQAIVTGLANAQLQGLGRNVAENVFDLLHTSTAGLNQGQRIARMVDQNIAVPPVAIGTNADGSILYGPATTKLNPDFNPMAANVAKYGGYANAAGALMQMGAGINEQTHGSRAASEALGAGGGALSGAVMGFSMGGPPGAVAGAVIGGVMGGLESSGVFGPKQTRGPSAEQEEYRRQQEASRERQETFSNIRQRQSALNVGMATGRAAYAQHGPQMNSFFRYPSYASSQGLVRSVESSIMRTLTPRW